MATTEEVKQAIKAVKNGMADNRQEQLAKEAGKQAGSTGNAAREAFRGR
jgi:hypothetical protein